MYPGRRCQRCAGHGPGLREGAGPARPARGRATVTVCALDFADLFAGPDHLTAVRQTTTGEDGAFRVDMPAGVEWPRELLSGGIQAGVWAGPAVGVARHARRGAGAGADRGELCCRERGGCGRAPIAGARVKPGWMIDWEGDGGAQIPEAVLAPAVTDARGKFRLAPLPAHCRLDLSVEHPGYALPLGASDRVRTGPADVTISLVPAGTITGRVISDDGRPAAQVGVDCLTTGTVVPAAITDAEGRFRFSRLLPGAYLLLPEPSEALAEFEAGTEQVVVTAGGEARCPDLTLKRLAGGPAVLSGKVADAATGQPIAGVEVGIQRLIAGPEMLDMALNGPTTWTGADGTYRMRLPPGTWNAWTGFHAGYTNGPVWNGPTEWHAAPGKRLTRGLRPGAGPGHHSSRSGAGRGRTASGRREAAGVAGRGADHRYRGALPLSSLCRPFRPIHL